MDVPSGKLTLWKTMGESTMSMAMFKSKLKIKNCQRVSNNEEDQENSISVPKVFSFEPETFAKEINSLAKGQVSALTSQD